MSTNDYIVIGSGHTHAGKELAEGAVIRLRTAQAERYPHIFQPKRATPSKADRVTRTIKPASTRTSTDSFEE